MSNKRRPAQHFEGLDAAPITITGLLILLFFAIASPQSSAAGNAKGKIAFVRGEGTGEEIYVMNADGSAQTRVTNNAVRDYFPVISPDGTKIAFESERNGNRDICVIDPDGTNELRLTTIPGVDLHPAWSPDGKRIAFSSDQNGNRDIYVMDANGINQTRVTTDPGSDLHPVYEDHQRLHVDDRFGESAETFSVTLSNPVGLILASPSSVTVTINSNESMNGGNPVVDPNFSSDFFVRQHYVDLFNREGDVSGLAFWKNQIDECLTQACREIRRINVSAAFFVSIEFQETGYLVYKANQAAFNYGEQLRLQSFLPDTQEIGRASSLASRAPTIGWR